MKAFKSEKLCRFACIRCPGAISWADVDRDLTAWTENDLQQDTIEKFIVWKRSSEVWATKHY